MIGMRKIIICLLAMAFIFLGFMPVAEVQGRQLRQYHSIDIEVECLDTAIGIIRELNGYNLESHVWLHESPHERAAWRSASFVRRVDYWAFGHVQYVLRNMGEVHFETENAHFLGAQIVDADTRILALSQEIERLSIMMAASDSLDVLIAIDARISQVVLERNSVIGTRNVLMAQAASPIINITINETMGERPAPVRDGFFSRVAGNFMGSLRGTGVAAGNLLVFIVRIFIPLVIYVALGFVVFRVYVKFKRKWDGRPTPVRVDAPHGEIESKEDNV